MKKRAILAASGSALFLFLIKLVVGLATGTVSVLASAVDSLLDFLVSGLNFLAVGTSEKPSDETYNYGRGKIEGIASTLEGLFILASAVFILHRSLDKLLRPEADPAPLLWPMGVMAVSILVTFLLVLYLRRVKRATGSLIVESDSLHYTSDLLSNAGVLLALVLMHFTGWRILDPLVALAVAGYVLFAAGSLVRRGVQMLLDRALDPELVERIRRIASGHSPRISGMHELKTRRAGDTNFVEFHLVFDEDISLRAAHALADEIEMKIRGLASAKWIISIHLDPRDDSMRDQVLAGIRS